MSNLRNVSILVFDDVEVLDFRAPMKSSTLQAKQLLRHHSTFTPWASLTSRLRQREVYLYSKVLNCR